MKKYKDKKLKDNLNKILNNYQELLLLPPSSDKIETKFREKIELTDIESIHQIIESSKVFSSEELKIAIELAYERLTKGVQSGYHFLFAEHAGKVIGYSCFGPITGTEASYDIYWIAIHKNFQGQGIGKRLLGKTESMIIGQKGRLIYIETSSRKQYDKTRSFYRACGYREEAVLKDFYSKGDSKIIYCKEIMSQNTY